jgi:hypothetical protein
MSSQQQSPERESLEKEVTHALEEARMVLPGVQALFGFQLVAVYNGPFSSLLSRGEQRLHLLAVFLTVLTVVVMMTPAAYHRQVNPHSISRGFVTMASYLLTAGMFVLMLSLWADCYLIARIILQSKLWSALAVGLLGTVQLGLWFVLPRLSRARRGA